MEALTSYFAQQGILGIIIIMLTGVIIWQQRRIDGKDTQIKDLQEKRVTDINNYSGGFTQLAKETVAAARDSLNAQGVLQKSVEAMAKVVDIILVKMKL